MAKHIILTSCTQNKSAEHAPMVRRTVPQDYLLRPQSVTRLLQVRTSVWNIPGSGYNASGSEHYGYDMYVRDPRTQLYSNLRNEQLTLQVREKLLVGQHNIDWFFLSGGYGILHALEVGRIYQATLSHQIARKAKIPCTISKWKKVLPELLDEMFQKSGVESVHAFGSQDYIQMVRATKLFKSSPNLFVLIEGRANDFESRRRLVETVRNFFALA